MSSTSSDPEIQPRARVNFVRLAIVVGILIVIGNLLIYLGHSAVTGSNPQKLPAEVHDVLPAPSSLVRPLETVSVQLDPRYTGILQIDGKEIPLDQLNVVPGQGSVSFRPGKNKDIEEFTPGTHAVTVVYWKEIESRNKSHSYTWSFRVG